MAHHSCGGLSLISVEHYALSLHLSQLSYFLPGTVDPPQWVQIERDLLHSWQGLDLLYGAGDARIRAAHPVVQAMVKSWQGVYRLFDVDTHLHEDAPLLCNVRLRIGARCWNGGNGAT
ncbi:hypothetical protein NDU88_008678 [Pleurodeles waltl]|uniref:Uncharacterized protein n=1 Tax=Pleurodeles waltl TaxID=8319 RepID=A0AAV7QSF5_PLEWA|nr:hypothetical protein NDU88_008678 [Pleurodeles waltl]